MTWYPLLSVAISSRETHRQCDGGHSGSLPRPVVFRWFPSSGWPRSQKRGLLMLSPHWKFFVAALVLIPISRPMTAEQPGRSEISRADLPDEPYVRPHPLTQSSGYIFAGTVKSVELAAPAGNGVATVLISFHVDQAIRGVRTGQTLAIREWAGLWDAGERYRPGERVLLFLYPPSKLGLTSPVRGPMGRFGIDPNGQVIVDTARIGVRSGHPGIAARFQGRTRVSPREFVRFFQSEED
jgi:hypothetical protein